MRPVVPFLFALGCICMGPPPATGTLWWQRAQPQPPALAPLVPAPYRDPAVARPDYARPQK